MFAETEDEFQAPVPLPDRQVVPAAVYFREKFSAEAPQKDVSTFLGELISSALVSWIAYGTLGAIVYGLVKSSRSSRRRL